MRASSRPDSPSATRNGRKTISTVRIIGGRWKRTPLRVMLAPGLRPTPERVRETVFNWLTHQFEGSLEGRSVLDLFAGSGAMGFEAASRGAGRVVMVDQDAVAVAEMRAVQARLSAAAIEIYPADAMTTAQSYRQAIAGASSAAAQAALRFDMIFLDPPYHSDWLARLLPLMADLLSPQGLLYAEAENALEEAAMALLGLELVCADKAGQVFYHLLRLRS